MWLLINSIKAALEKAHLSGVMPTAEQQAQYIEFVQAADTSRVLSIAGSNAEIHVKGVLTNAPDWMAMFFGGGNTTYPEIVAALAEADSNPEIDEIVMRFDSGGGSVFGMFETQDAIRATEKPVRAVIGSMAASAAYLLASAADTIEASSKASITGSVGIVRVMHVDENEVTLTSSEAPNKKPDVTTEEGRAVVVDELNAWHDLYVEAVAEGRGTTPEKVNSDFGRGGIVLAEDALKRGMIDSIAPQRLESVKSTKSTTAESGNPEVQDMDINELKAKHPATYQAAVEEGQNKERDRVGAHLTMGAASGDMKTAIAAVEDGSAMTATLQAKYMTAGMNRNDVSARQDDDADAGGADNADENVEAEKGADVATLIESKLGMGDE